MKVQDIWVSPTNPVIRIPSSEETEGLVSFLKARWIGFVAEASRPVPPGGYGGAQYVIDDLNRFLRDRGIDTVFFGTANSTIEATEKVPIVPSPVLREGQFADKTMMDAADLVATTWLREYSRAGRLHLANLHTPYIGPPEYLEEVGVPILLTPHWSADGEWNARQTAQIVTATGGSVVFLSKSQMNLYGEGLNTLGVIYNPVDVKKIKPKLTTSPTQDLYLAFLGRCGPEKRPDLAAKIAIASGIRLKMVIQCMTSENWQYFHEIVEPIVSTTEGRTLIDWEIKEIGFEEKLALYRDALALLFPITWDEICALTPLESMATGTPILAFDWGYIPEAIAPEVGYVVKVHEEMAESTDWDGIEEKAVKEAASAVREVIPKIDRRRCRRHVEENFSLEVVGRRYLAAYGHLLGY